METSGGQQPITNKKKRMRTTLARASVARTEIFAVGARLAQICHRVADERASVERAAALAGDAGAVLFDAKLIERAHGLLANADVAHERWLLNE